MNRACTTLYLGMMIGLALGCGESKDAVKCKLGPDDGYVRSLVGEPCAEIEDASSNFCQSNNGCGGCTVMCKDGVWTPTDTDVCYSVGGGC